MTQPVRVTFLGGLGEIGRNCAALELDDRILLIDCGLLFPSQDMHGVDLVLPDFAWLRERRDRIVGCIATHGHEDHVGGLSFLLRELPLSIYGSALTLGLARNRIEEAGLLGRAELVPVRDGERRTIGPFECEFIPVTHSVPHGFATAFHTPQGLILHSGDFKLDLTPIDGRLTDLSRIGALADGPGIRLLLSDSTNADEIGHSASERSIGQSLHGLFAAQGGRRLIIACFASHIHRVQQIADAAIAQGRKVATLGLSMRKNVRLAREMGVLQIPDAALVDIEDADDIDPGRLCVVCTGSQGEPMSALSLMAEGESRWLKVGPDDTVILSSTPIPGNEANVTKVIDGLIRLGAEVVHSGIAEVHSTGHAKTEELKTLLSVVRPEWFVPVHGEYRHLVHHARLAQLMGVEPARTLICTDGDQIELTDAGITKIEPVPAEYVFVHGTVGDIGHGVIQERRILGSEGVVMVTAVVDTDQGALVAGPRVVTRGWVHEPDADDLLDEVTNEVAEALSAALGEGVRDADELQRRMRRTVGRFVSSRTRRRPMIVPVLYS